MSACSAYGCKNRRLKKTTGITFHCFPKDPEKRQQWIKAVKRENWTPSYCSLLCSTHFKEADIDRTSLCVVRIREGAVPSIFPEYRKPKVKNLNNKFRKIPDKSNYEYVSDRVNDPVAVKVESSQPVQPPRTSTQHSLTTQSSEVPQVNSCSQSLTESQLIGGKEGTVLDHSKSDQCQSNDDWRIGEIVKDASYVDDVLKKLGEVSEKFDLVDLAKHEDELDQFGIYVVSLLRSLPSQKSFELQKKVIDLILESQTESIHTKETDEQSSNKVPKIVSSETLIHPATRNETLQGQSSMSVPVAMPSPITVLPMQSSETPQASCVRTSETNSQTNSKRKTPVDASESTQTKRTRIDDFDEEKRNIDGALKKLDEMSEAFSLLSQSEDCMDHFGRYLASLIRCYLSHEQFIFQKKVIDLILESLIEPDLKVKENIRVVFQNLCGTSKIKLNESELS